MDNCNDIARSTQRDQELFAFAAGSAINYHFESEWIYTGIEMIGNISILR